MAAVSVGLMDALAHCAFAVGLKSLKLGAKLVTQSIQAGIDLIQRNGAVLPGVALAKHVVVDAVEHEDFHGVFLCCIDHRAV